MTMNRVDRSAFEVGDLWGDGGEKNYWFSRTPVERLRALELIRGTIYGYSDSASGLQRILEVAEFTAS
jgi:hypothetical protein